MQASVYGKPRILSALSRTLHLESGIVDKFGLSFVDGCAAFLDDFVLDVFLFRFYLSLNFYSGRFEFTELSLLFFEVVLLAFSTLSFLTKLAAIASTIRELSDFRVTLLLMMAKA